MHQDRGALPGEAVRLVLHHALPSCSHPQVPARAEGVGAAEAGRRRRHLHCRPQLPQAGVHRADQHQVRACRRR